MNIVQITPGAGAMYCGNCLRDNALVAALRRMGHDALMVPLYLPLTLDEDNQSAGTPIFFGGVNVYLEQKSALFRNAPDWLHNLLASPGVLKWAAGKTAQTRAADLGDITLSMLRGEDGFQARELEELIRWLKTQPKPDVICLSNALLVGLVRRLKTGLGAPVICMLQGEDAFLDGLPETHRAACWKTLAERAAEADLFVAPSRYFCEVMRNRLDLPSDRVKVVYNGINLAGYAGAESDERIKSGDGRSGAPVLGFFARMCREKGLDVLVDAFIQLRRGRAQNLKLKVGGSCGPADEPFVNSLRERLRGAGLLGEVEFHPNLDRVAKVNFLKSLSVFSVPAVYSEAFGLYVIEALAAGVPVVQPRASAFPELIEATSGGLLFQPGSAQALADAIGQLISNPDRARTLGETGRHAVHEKFSAEAMARETLALYRDALTVCPTNSN